MANAVAALYTSLTLESSQFIANAKRTATATEKMSNDISKSLTVAKSAVQGFIAVAGVGLLTSGIKNALNYASAIGETAQQLGIATKAYQELTYAATQSGVSQQELEAGLARLTRNIGQGAKVFGELGIKIRDAGGNSRATGDVFNDIAAKLGKVTDPAKRAAYEVELFGKAGQKLDTLLSGGTAAIGALADEANRLGLVLSDKQIANADKAADTFAKVKFQLDANIAGTVSDNASAIISLANAMGEIIRVGGKAISAVKGFGDAATISAASIANALPWTSDRVKTANRAAIAGAQRNQQGGIAQSASIMGGTGGADWLQPRGGGGLADPGATATKVAKVAKTAPAATKAVYDFTAALEGMTKIDASIAGEGGALSIFQTDDQMYNDTVSKLTTLGDMTSLIQPVELIDKEQLARVEKFGESLSSNLATALVYGQNLGDALVNSLKAAAAEALASGLFSILTGAIGGGFSGLGASISGFFGGKRANGGPVSAGKAYLVGERGPEILTGASGRIIPNHALGGGSGGSMTVNVDARGSNDPAAVRAQVMLGIAQAAPALVAAARGETISQLRRPSLAGGRG